MEEVLEQLYCIEYLGDMEEPKDIGKIQCDLDCRETPTRKQTT